MLIKMLKKIGIIILGLVIFSSLLIIIISHKFDFPYDTLRLPRPNPTSYVFKATIPQIHNIIYSMKDSCFCSIQVVSAEVYDRFQLLKTDENKNDIVIYYFNPHTSYIYQGKKEPIYYSFSIHLHIVAISDTTTFIDVRTLDGNILAGVYGLEYIIHHGSVYTKAVPPSSIEEYQLLLQIGEKLGMKGEMPSLILPESIGKNN